MSKLFLKNISNDGSAIIVNYNGKNISLGDKEEREFDMPKGSKVALLTTKEATVKAEAPKSKKK